MIVLQTINNEDIYLNSLKNTEEGSENSYHLIDEDKKVWLKLHLNNNHFEIQEKNEAIKNSDEEINELLDDLVLQVIEQEQLGTESTESLQSQVSPYNPELIKVNTKPFSIKLVHEMIESGDIDLNPDFQRNFVWTPIQKSKLIESILLKIPLPMFYFSEDDEGRITVVDGLQRLTTIRDYMENKFPLKGLEYLATTCEGRYYKEEPEKKKKGLDAKFFRWFNMTQFTVNVIDSVSPSGVKYDIFKRINTGGKPLNNQEIRNCFSSKSLRSTLQKMVSLEIFKKATDKSIKSVRMEDQEVALRFISFYLYYAEDKSLNNYNGNMELSLDDITDKLGKEKEEALNKYVVLFSKAMENAYYLFGRNAFRKVLPKHLTPVASKQLINKALFVVCSVLLSQYDFEDIKANNAADSLTLPLANLIEDDRSLHNYLSYGTNGKINLQYAFEAIEGLIKTQLKK